MLEIMNRAMFDVVNAPTDPNQTILMLARFSAQWLLYVVALGMIVGWLVGNAKLRRALIVAGMALVLGLIINRVIGALWYHARPFELGVGTNFLDHSVDSSFPSDHATLLFSVALALLFSPRARLLGALAMLIALAVAWSRVYVGVHWPLDMAGSFAVSALAVALVLGAMAGLTDRLYTLSSAISGKLLGRFG